MPYTLHHKISELIIKHLRSELTGEERTELNAWINATPENKALYEQLTTEETLAKEVNDIAGIRARILNTIYNQLPGVEIGHEEHNGYTKNTKVVPMYKRRAFKWIAAAVMLFAIVTTAIVISKRSEKSPAPMATTHDVPAPTNTRAVITPCRWFESVFR